MPSIDILFSFIITTFSYLFIPIIFIIIGKKRTKRSINLISLLSFILGSLILSLFLFNLNSGITSFTGGGSLIWTLSGNWLMKKKISYEVDPIEAKRKSVKLNREQMQKEKTHMKAITKGFKSTDDMMMHYGNIILIICVIVLLLFILIPNIILYL